MTRAGATLLSLACILGSCGRKQEPAVERFPSAPVEILIDDMGVPHIYAQNDADVFYGAGYQMATDRLYQMEMLRRFAYGRLAEVLGEAGLERDKQARVFDLPRWGRADAELMRKTEAERARLLRAWVAGINARV